MKKFYAHITCLQLLTLAAAPSVFATQPNMMDEVLVTASRTEETIKSVSANATIISREDIERSSAANVGDLLAEQSIATIKKYPGSLISVDIRGFKTDTHGNDLQGHVLVLLDGRRAGSGNLAKILTRNVERIEIIRGPGAVQYGSAGMGGVINVITRQGTDNSMFVEAKGGSFDTGETSVGGTALVNGLDFAGAYGYGTTGDYKTGNGDTYKNTGINYETGLSANLGYSFSSSRIAMVVTSFKVDEAGNPGFINKNDLDNYSDKDNYSVDLNYKGLCPLTGSEFLARYFFGKDQNSWLDPMASNASGWDDGRESSNKTDQQGAQFQLSNGFGPVSFTAGFDWLDYEVNNSWTPNKTTYENPALFLLTKGTFLDDSLRANIGLRYDWYDVKVEEPAGRNADDSHFTPQMGVVWMATESLKIRAQYGEAFTMPSADQMAADYLSFGTHRVLGNPNLGPETSNTYEGGVDYSQHGLDVSLTYFYTDFKDKIVATYLISGSQSWDNIGEATISGVEAELAYDIGTPLNLAWEIRPYVNTTILDTYEDDSTGEDLQYISGTNFSAGLILNNGEGISCRLNVAYSGSQDIIDYASGYPYQNTTLSSNTVTDLTASWRVYENEQTGVFTLRGEVSNLFDTDYAYVHGYPMPGRGVFLGLRWDY
jgi:vitamin B12 transporter